MKQLNQTERVKLHLATEQAINHYRTWVIRKLMRSPASLHVMMDVLKLDGITRVR